MAYPVEPNSEFFVKPDKLKPGYGTTVTDEGHIYGYLTPWAARLIGSGTKNTRPPKSKTNMAYANAFNLKCADGTIIRTGVLAGEGGHHYRGTFQASQSAYADVKNKVANVVYGEDAHGAWFTGALCPSVDAETAQQIRSSGVSGHWERPAAGKSLELLGSCLVNIPGFAQASNHRIAASASLTPDGGITITPELETGNGREDADADRFAGNGNTRITGAGSRITAAASRLVPISGVLAALGTPTVDGRQVNNVQWDRLPMPLWYLDHQNCWGHENAVIVGRIDDIRIEGSLVMFDGMLEEGLGGSASAEAVASLDVLGISMDGKVADESEILYEYDEYGWPTKATFELYEIFGGTLTSQPAFQETLGVSVNGSIPTKTETTPTDGEEPATDTEASANYSADLAAFGATDFADLPLAGREDEWDSEAAEANVREWAGGEDDMDWEKYRKAFAWYDSDMAEEFGGYKLQFADVVDGELTAVPRGVFAVAAALEGSRGGVDIPEDDVTGVQAHIASYYDKMAKEFEDDSIVPPWEDEGSGVAASAKSGFTTIKLPVFWH